MSRQGLQRCPVSAGFNYLLRRGGWTHCSPGRPTGAVAASIGAPRTKEKASIAANAYRALQQDARIFVRIDLDTLPLDDARRALDKLVDRLQQLNRGSEIPSGRAWEKARRQLEAGSQTFKGDAG